VAGISLTAQPAAPRDTELRLRGINASDEIQSSVPAHVDRGLGGAVLEEGHPDVRAAGLRRQADAPASSEIDAVAGAGRGVVNHHAIADYTRLSGDREAPALEVVEAGQERDRTLTGQLDPAHVRAGRQGQGGRSRVVDGREGG